MFSCSQFAGGSARNPGLVALILLLGTLHVTKQAGGAVGVGTCRTVAAGSVSVPGTCLCPVLWTGSCLSVVCVGFWSELSEVGLTRGIRLGAAQLSCGLRREVTLAYAALGARRWLGTRPVGPVCTTFGRSTMFLSL